MNKVDKWRDSIPYWDRKYYTRLVLFVVFTFYFIIGMKEHRPDLLKIFFWPMHTHDFVELWNQCDLNDEVCEKYILGRLSPKKGKPWEK